PGENSSQSPSQINHHCCYGCGDSLEDIFCHQCTCELCGKGAHYGYNCPPKVLIIPNLEPCNNQTVDELPHTLLSFDSTCYSEDGNPFTYDSRSNLGDDSPNVFNLPPQPPTYSYKFCGNDAYYGHDCPLQDCTIAITPILSTKEPDKSLSMGDKHLDTIPATESDEFIKSSIEDLVPNPKTRLIKRLLYDNSSPRPLKEFIYENSDTAIESFSPSPIPVEDSDSFVEEIDLSFTPNDPMSPGIGEDDYDSERDILILEELLSNDSLSLSENESFHFVIPSSSRPLAKPPDGNSGILNVKMMGDIFEHKVPMPRLTLTQPTLVLNQEKSPNLLSH
nr:hypothetical protein [Tanacetum cinerariifolium]